MYMYYATNDAKQSKAGHAASNNNVTINSQTTKTHTKPAASASNRMCMFSCIIMVISSSSIFTSITIIMSISLTMNIIIVINCVIISVIVRWCLVVGL